MNSANIQGENRHSVAAWERSARQCSVVLPDGSCSSISLRPGSLIREVLQDLCQNISVNIAAVDLFLVGGEKVRGAGGRIRRLEEILSAPPAGKLLRSELTEKKGKKTAAFFGDCVEKLLFQSS